MTAASPAADPAANPTDQLALIKLHGLGNDFLVVLSGAHDDRLPALNSDVARRLCDRHRGIGADGLILGRRNDPNAPGISNHALLDFRLWNADGGEAEVSGNGLRCLAHAALDAGWVPDDETFAVVTPAGRREVLVRHTPTPGRAWAKVNMGEAKVLEQVAEDVCNVGDGALRVDIGNPHLVVLGPDPANVDVATLGPQLEHADPAGLNVEFVALGPGPDEITMRVWERGAGETQACGSGACAAVAALHHWGRVGTAVTVHQLGGDASVERDSRGGVSLAGPSERIADCVVALEQVMALDL